MAIKKFKKKQKKNPENNKCWLGCAEIGTITHCGGNENGADLWKSLAVSQKVKHRITI